MALKRTEPSECFGEICGRCGKEPGGQRCFVHLYPTKKKVRWKQFSVLDLGIAIHSALQVETIQYPMATYGKLNFYGKLWEISPKAYGKPMGSWKPQVLFFKVLHYLSVLMHGKKTKTPTSWSDIQNRWCKKLRACNLSHKRTKGLGSF